MSVSHRRHRVKVYTLGDSGSEGYSASDYTIAPSTSIDKAWWASRAVPTGRETTIGAQAEHAADGVFGFAAQAPVTADSVLKTLNDGRVHRVLTVLPRSYGVDELQVLTVHVDDAQYSLLEP